MNKKVTPKITLGIIESIVENKAEFKQWGPFEEFEIMEIEGFEADLHEDDYRKAFMTNFFKRIQFVESRQTEKNGVDTLPSEALKSLYHIISELNSFEGNKESQGV